ncbi:MAG: long-chain-acyl-CoA synthetase [Deltaproteobacteria bacterium]|nr:long-chain-acyl-CoA synthetase [Deltaproteobacteria bacterium]
MTNAVSLPTRAESEARLAAVRAKIAERLSDATLAAFWQERVRLAPGRPVIRTDARTLDYQAFDTFVARVARWARAAGLRPGDAVALQLPASPAFLALLLGLAEAGARLSLLGTGLRGRSLAHALREIPVSLAVTTAEVAPELESLGVLSVEAIHVLASVDAPDHRVPPDHRDAPGPGDPLDALDALLTRGGVPPSRAFPRTASNDSISPDDTLFYIFTSGTTGLPKATRCSHRRYLAGAISEGVLLEMDATDCMYVVLPMFHIAALSAIGAALSVSASIAIRERFSASRFWTDVHAFGATTFQYLGEVLRYLLARPPSPLDRPNPLRAMIGAGVDARVGNAFEARFGPVRIVESYGSSEGVIGIFNLDGVVGSVGRAAPELAGRLALARVDAARDALARDAAGRLIRCAPGEAGELLARLADRGEFEGYSSAEATRSKLLENAFEEGDLWYRSGDLFREREGYYFFVARLGDTYRWKGENVSAQQVAEAIEGFPAVAHAVVYGVEVPGHEGRAGMALVALAAGRAFDGEALVGHLERELPAFAWPLFVRLGDGRAVLTDTYKLGLADLKQQGYAPERVGDPLYVLDAAARRYVELTEAALARLGLPSSEG